jgi:RNA polymerase sigma-70 factor (ECF subfamily)
VVGESPAQDVERARSFLALFDDESMFRRWYDESLPHVYSYLLSRCGGDASAAKELTQEAFVEAVRKRTAFGGESDALAWVLGIAKHKLADHFRRLAREKRRHLRLISSERSLGMAVARFDSREAVIAALAKLPAVQRAALTLHYLDQMPMREIADVLGKSESAVESLLARGRDNFRVSYEEQS